MPLFFCFPNFQLQLCSLTNWFSLVLVLPAQSGLSAQSSADIWGEQVTPTSEQPSVPLPDAKLGLPGRERRALHPRKSLWLTVLRGIFISPIPRQSLPSHQTNQPSKAMYAIRSQWTWKAQARDRTGRDGEG